MHTSLQECGRCFRLDLLWLAHTIASQALAAAAQLLWHMQIAASLKAEKLILMTDVPGVLRDKDDVDTKFVQLDIRQTRELVADCIIAGGMIPK